MRWSSRDTPSDIFGFLFALSAVLINTRASDCCHFKPAADQLATYTSSYMRSREARKTRRY